MEKQEIPKRKTKTLERLRGEANQVNSKCNELKAQIDVHVAAKRNALAKASALEIQLCNARESNLVQTSRIINLETDLLKMKAEVVDVRAEVEEVREKVDKKVAIYLKDDVVARTKLRSRRETLKEIHGKGFDISKEIEQAKAYAFDAKFLISDAKDNKEEAGPDEYNRVSACDFFKEIWEALQTAHEGTTQVKQSKFDMLTTEYEIFKIKDDESIQDMHTRITSIINELHSLGDVIPRNRLVRKILSVLPGSWESKVNAITKAKDLQTLTMDELIGNLKTYEMNIKKDSERREPKKEKNLEQYKQNLDKAAKRNLVRDKRFSQKSTADNIMKQALAAWGDSSSKSEREPDVENSSIMAVETEATKYDSLFALMAQSNDNEEYENDEANFRDVQRNLKSYSSKKLRSLANVLIDAYYSLINYKEILTIELGDAE
ncbi:WEB family protein At5g16730, chloroplastic-like [Nicotiana sylvestris]|uniref:WEB family protein At5g16730, chloroplastic-like n=1 Tax=Nicotiana sylvestris TaxID=4096 RepID=UPI00388CE726